MSFGDCGGNGDSPLVPILDQLIRSIFTGCVWGGAVGVQPHCLNLVEF